MARILVIDDDETILLTLELLLEAAGHHVTLALDGLMAAADFDPDCFDLILTDIIMPERDGLETITAVRRLSARVGIIAMSGGVAHSQNYLKIAARLGADRTLAKPFTPLQLHEAIAATLAARPAPTISHGHESN